MTLPAIIPAHNSPTLIELPHPLQLARCGVSGFPSPAEDYQGDKLDLSAYFIKRPSASFFMTVDGDSMREYGIMDGSKVLVDRSVKIRPGLIVVVLLDGEIVIKAIEYRGNTLCLCSGGDRYAPIPVTALEEHESWGVVTSVHTSTYATTP